MVRLEGMKQVPGRQVVPLTRLHSIQYDAIQPFSLFPNRTRTFITCTFTTQFNNMHPSLSISRLESFFGPLHPDSRANNDSRRILHMKHKASFIPFNSSDRLLLLSRRHKDNSRSGKFSPNQVT